MTEDKPRIRVLFLSTRNSTRSQMAEGWLRYLAHARYEAHSAGIQRGQVHALAIRAMAEVGIDISHHTSKLVVGLVHEPWDYVVTVSDHANETCPIFPAKPQRLHWGFSDPSPAEKLRVFRRVRDDVGDCVKEWLADQPELESFVRPRSGGVTMIGAKPN